MEKNFLQDVVPPAGKKSIRNIPVPENRKRGRKPKKEEISEIEEEQIETSQMSVEEGQEERHIHPQDTESPEDYETEEEEAEDMPPVKPPKHFDKSFTRKNKKSWPKYVTGLILVALVFVLLSSISSAEIVITPKRATARVDASLPVTTSADGNNALVYKTVELTESLSKNAKPTGEEEVSEKASGSIIVFNDYSETEQKLIKNTRFESPEGYIYRIEESVTVPGKSGSKPGSIEVTVVADETGKEYNTDLTDFTIPGFEGLPQYESFYARSKTPISGGFEGVRKVVAAEDVQQIRSELESALTETLIHRANSQFAKENVALFDSEDFSFSSKQSDAADGTVAITVTGKLDLVVIDIFALSSKIAEEVLVNYNPEETVFIENIDSLETELNLSGENFLSVNGQPNFKWITDTEALTHSVLDIKRDELKQVLTSYPSISKADAVIKPFWKRSFPENPEKITVIEADSNIEN